MTAPLPRLRCTSCGRRYPGLPPRLCPKDATPLVPDDGLATEAPEPAAPATSLAGEEIAGRIVLERQLASGSFGAVYAARRPGKDGQAERCVVKVFHPHLAANGSHLERFVREAKALKRIEHPNVVHLLDAGALPDGRLFLALEHGGEQTLAQLIARGPMEPLRALRIAAQVLSALHAAHKEGIVHRDLKPANILVSRAGSEERVKVCDFGVAKLLSTFEGADELSALTKEGGLVGTPAYFSPEQACGLPVDARTDLYALGVVLYEMLAGRRPLHATTVRDWVRAHTEEEPPAFERLGVSVPATVEAIVRKAIAKVPEQRYRSAKEMQGAVAALLGAPVPSTSERFLTRRQLREQEGTSTEQLDRPNPFWRRHLGTAAMLVVFALVGAAAWWQLWARPACWSARQALRQERWADAVRLAVEARVYGVGCVGVEPIVRPEKKSGLDLLWISTKRDDGFWLTRTEVTHGAFDACVHGNVCTRSALDGCGAQRKPGACVGEAQAAKACRWMGGRLPTEAELKTATQLRDEGRAPWLDGALPPEDPLGFRCVL